jgi:hypothetical protein
MKAINTIGFLSVLAVATVLAQNASALPDSSMNDWEGHRTVDNVYVEWAVYGISENPWTQVSFLSQDLYVYAYQIANLGETPVQSFCLLEDFGGDRVDWSSRANGTQAVVFQDGKMPDPNPSAAQGEWEWSTAGDGFISNNGYSAILILGSPNAPKAGGFEVNADKGEPSIPTPEPATLALLGIASAMFVAKRGKKRQAG